jgi:hypothetical protein
MHERKALTKGFIEKQIHRLSISKKFMNNHGKALDVPGFHRNYNFI